MSEPEEAPPLDAVTAMREQGKSPELAAVLAWLVPGTGHLYAGHRVKGALAVALVLGLHLVGLVLSRGDAVSLDEEEGHPYAFIAQVGVGLPTLVTLAHSRNALPFWPAIRPDTSSPEYVARLPQLDTGLLFTMVAGLANLLLVHDVLQGVPGAIARRAEEARQRRAIEAIRNEHAGSSSRPPPPDAAAA